MTPSLTTIPIEVLFGALGTLITVIGLLLAWIGKSAVAELKAVRHESNSRGRQIAAVHTILGVICGKLGIDYNPPDP